jgi:hypothetical protein
MARRALNEIKKYIMTDLAERIRTLQPVDSQTGLFWPGRSVAVSKVLPGRCAKGSGAVDDTGRRDVDFSRRF